MPASELRRGLPVARFLLSAWAFIARTSASIARSWRSRDAGSTRDSKLRDTRGAAKNSDENGAASQSFRAEARFFTSVRLMYTGSALMRATVLCIRIAVLREWSRRGRIAPSVNTEKTNREVHAVLHHHQYYIRNLVLVLEREARASVHVSSARRSNARWQLAQGIGETGDGGDSLKRYSTACGSRAWA